MNTYLYETHLHTRQASACSSCEAKDYIDLYKRAGYSGIIVTDHFYHGNTAIPRDYPWKDWVNAFCLGYEEARYYGDKIGFQVFFGYEENFDGDEYLIYGVDKQWLLNHPMMLHWSQEEQFFEVHKAGGVVVQAHPFRERDYITRINLHPNQCDAMETGNCGNGAWMDALTYEYCQKHKIVMTAGSDMHHAKNVSKDCFGMKFDEPLRSIEDYVNYIKRQKYQVKLGNSIENENNLFLPKDRFIKLQESTKPIIEHP